MPRARLKVALRAADDTAIPDSASGQPAAPSGSRRSDVTAAPDDRTGEEMRACVQCGAEYSDTADSCRSCGAVLEAQAATSVQPRRQVRAPWPGPGQPQPSATAPVEWHQQAQPAATMVADQPAGTGPAPTEMLGSGHRGPGSGLRRADALVLGASVLLFVASFLPVLRLRVRPLDQRLDLVPRPAARRRLRQWRSSPDSSWPSTGSPRSATSPARSA